MIIFYDFWLNLTNPQTHSITLAEIRRLFLNCVVELHKTGLTPSIAWDMVKLSWMLALLLESLKIFNTRTLAVIHAE